MLDTLYYVGTAIVVGYLAQLAYYLVSFVWKLRSVGWDVDELERRLDIEEAVAPEISDPKVVVVDLKAEAYNNVVYCFEVRTQKFACQGATVDEIKQHLKLRYGDYGVVGRIISITQEARAVLLASGADLGEE